MMINSKLWMRWAKLIVTPKRVSWLSAMEAELSEIAETKERNRFSFGCFVAVVQDAARSRRGLNYIARAIGMFSIIVMCSAVLWVSVKLGVEEETVAVSKLFMVLSFYYLISAGLLVISLRYLKLYAKIGVLLAMSAWSYCFIVNPKFESLPTSFLSALALEMAVFMIGLFIASIYLRWLYEPEEYAN